jgi:hypothetical protein
MRLFVSVLLSLVALSAWSKNETIDQEINQRLKRIEERINRESIEIKPQDFRWAQWERFERELNFAVAHDPVSEVNFVPDELHSERLNQQLEDRWEEFAFSASSMQLTDSNPVWDELSESMKKFFRYRKEQLYRLARAQMKSGEIRDPLEELYQQAAEKALKSVAANQVNLQVMDPVIKDLTKEIKKLSEKYSKLNPTAEHNNSSTWFVVASGLILTAAGIVFYRMKKKINDDVLNQLHASANQAMPTSTENTLPTSPLVGLKQTSEAVTTDSWMEQLEETLAKQQSLEIQQEQDLRVARDLVTELKNIIGKIQTAQDPETFYLQLEKLGIVTEAIDNFVARQDPLRYAEVPYVMTKLILSLSERIVPDDQKNIQVNTQNVNC